MRTDPFLSVITVVKNDGPGLERTLRSVFSQQISSGFSCESIVIDGGSSDNTLTVIAEYQKKIHYRISEPDNGIYDGMNKGLPHARGSWIIFLNAGDVFFSENTVSLFHEQSKKTSAGIIYGDVVNEYHDNYRKVKKAKSHTQLWKGMVFCHQAAFIKKTLFNPVHGAGLYKTEYKIAADYAFFSALYHTTEFLYWNAPPVAVIAAYGLSDKARFRTIREFCKIGRVYFKDKPVLSHFCFSFALQTVIAGMKLLLPRRLILCLKTKFK